VIILQTRALIVTVLQEETAYKLMLAQLIVRLQLQSIDAIGAFLQHNAFLIQMELKTKVSAWINVRVFSMENVIMLTTHVKSVL